ncbi:putative ribonuclease H-like domain-containing protein [Tanacetum coccineum]
MIRTLLVSTKPLPTTGLESVSIRRIQGVGYDVLEFLGVGITFDIFQNIHLLYLLYGVLVFSGYGVFCILRGLCSSLSQNVTKSSSSSDSVSKLKPAIALVIGLILCIGFTLICIILVYINYCHISNSIRLEHFGDLPRARSRSSGIDKKIIESLPYFKFSTLKGSKNGLECSVCLTAFEDVEVLRMLPKCKHAFHIECIDKWLEKNSSCPLCRFKVVMDDIALFRNSNSLRFKLSGPSSLGLYIEREGLQDLEQLLSSRSFVNSSEILKSENMDVTTIVTPSNGKKVESNHEFAGVKSNGDAVDPKTVRKNNFRPPVIEDWNSDDESEGNPQQMKYKEKRVIDSGFSRHMTGNKCYLTEYEDYNGGFVSFGYGKGRISRKVLSSDFKLLDKSQVLLRVPRKDNIYSVDLKSVVPTKGLTCLFAKATIDESNLWHRRLSHINFKNMNKLVRGNLVRVVTDDFSRFSWVFFLATKDETSGILKTFITEIENQLDYKVKVIISDNGTEFKNSVMNHFCEMKGIKREFSVARTPQQNGVAERRNRTLIEAARTMLVDSKLPTTFWAEAVNTACYVLNRVLVIKPHNKTPYELIRGRTPLIDFMKPFGCPVTILNTRDHLGKFDGKADEGFFVGYSVVSKAMRVFNKRTRIVEETLNIRFLENTPNVTGNGPDWLFDVDSLTISMNYVPVVAGNQTNGIAGTRDNIVTGQAEKKTEPEQEYILIPICTTDPLISQDPKVSEEDAEEKPTKMDESGASDKDGKDDQATRSEFERLLQQEKQTVHPNSTNSINTVSTPVSTAGPSFTNDGNH